MADNDLSGAELDARFFEVCWGWKQYPMGERMLWRHEVPCGLGRMTKWEYDLPEVTDDANACEAWAMRWAREQGLMMWIHDKLNECCAELESADDFGIVYVEAKGQDWKEAFVRACVAAAEAMQKHLTTKGE